MIRQAVSMRLTSVPQLFVFDLDDTLMQTQIDYTRAREALFQMAQEVFGGKTAGKPEELIREFMDLDRMRSETMRNNFGRFPGTCAEFYRMLAMRHQVAHNPAVERQFLALGYEVFNPAHWAERGLIAGAPELLAALKRDNHHLMLCTRGDPTAQMMKIKVLGLEQYFDYSDIDIVEKKDEALFQRKMAMFRMQHALIAEYPTCWSIGDWYDADIAPALAAGFRGLFIQREEIAHNRWESQPKGIDGSRVLVVRDVSEIIALYQGGKLK